jgi:PAS domain S-box-containing protein/putative nucleotidyltransferase with HDIG domain
MKKEDRSKGITQDITERRQRQDIVRLAVVMRESSDAIIIQDSNGYIIAWNNGATKMYGYSEKEALGMNIERLMPPGEIAEQKDFFRRLIAGEAVTSFETHRLAKDGSILDIWLVATKIAEEPTDVIISTGQDIAKPISIALMERNITERKKVEESLRSSKQIIEGIINAIPVRVFWKDKDLIYLGCNTVFACDAGFEDPKDIIGKNDYQMGWRAQAKLYRNDDHQVIKTGRSKLLIEEPQTTPEGKMITLLTSKIPLHNSKGEISGILGTYMDITERKQSEEKLKKSLAGTIKVISEIAELRDPYTAGHQRKVSGLATTIAQELGLSKEMIDNIQMAALIHDIGKMSIPSEILSNPGKLSRIQMELIKVHSMAGFIILKDAGLPEPVAQIVLQHHERLDGSGYPDGAQGEAILLEARILAVADVVEAMTSHRPYRPSLGIDMALAEIVKNKGVFYDPMVVDACQAIFKRGYGFDA